MSAKDRGRMEFRCAIKRRKQCLTKWSKRDVARRKTTRKSTPRRVIASTVLSCRNDAGIAKPGSKTRK